MKKIILSLIASLLFCMSGKVYAEDSCDYCNGNSRSFYVKALGGANFLQTEHSGDLKSDYQTGFIVSGSFGYRWRYGLRFEAEYAYRRNSLNKVRFFGRSFDIHGHFQSHSYMANLLWDVPLGCWASTLKLRPFIGGGIGYDYQQLRAHNINESKGQFAWQAIAGLFYPIFCHTDISLEYKCHQGGFTHIFSHSIGVGITYHFGHKSASKLQFG